MTSTSRLGRLIDDAGEAMVERAIGELRADRPVLINGESGAALAVGIEALDGDLAGRLDHAAEGQARLVLARPRLRRLGSPERGGAGTGAGVIALPVVQPERIRALAVKTGARLDAPVAMPQPLDDAALELARLALMLPAVVVLPVAQDGPHNDDPHNDGLHKDGRHPFLRVAAADIARYRRAKAHDIRIVGRAPVPLENAPETEFVVFRGGEGFRDQVAIVIGRPDRDRPVPVRLHSACLTGDLFGSLKCDCGDQLRDAVGWMAANGGGILLYLDQEGRGNGIANKMRAYRLQSLGFDTYEADEILGFGLDPRRFDFAAAMLRQLGVHAVTLMTNNPSKIDALREAGLDVVAARRVFGRATDENQRYLEAKRDRAGHLFDFEMSAARSSAHD